MTDKEAADGLRRDSSVLEKVLGWVRRHLFARGGGHGDKSVEVGFRVEF